MAERLAVLDSNRRAAAHAGHSLADLGRRVLVIGPYDVLIAGHARSQGLWVITGNLGEFRRVDGVRAEDWLTQAWASQVIAGNIEALRSRGSRLATADLSAWVVSVNVVENLV